jgi:hypothetical protein
MRLSLPRRLTLANANAGSVSDHGASAEMPGDKSDEDCRIVMGAVRAVKAKIV